MKPLFLSPAPFFPFFLVQNDVEVAVPKTGLAPQVALVALWNPGRSVLSTAPRLSTPQLGEPVQPGSHTHTPSVHCRGGRGWTGVEDKDADERG